MELQNIQTSESQTNLYRDNIETMDTLQSYSCMDKMKRSFRLFTVELMLILYIFVTFIASDARMNLPYEMACRVNLKLNDTICSNRDLWLSNVSQLLDDADQQSTKLQTSSILELNLSELIKPGNDKSISSTTVAMIMLMCFATFSDQHKMRKTFIILAVLGDVFTSIGMIMCTVYVSTWPLERLVFMVLFLPAFFGGDQTLQMAVYSNVSDITTEENRTFRMCIVEIAFSLSTTPLFTPLSLGLFHTIGYYGIFCTDLILFVVALLCVHIFLKDNPKPELDCNLFFDLFNPKTVVVDMSNVLIKKRVAYRRFLLIMTYLCYILIKGPMEAEQIYFLTYTKRIDFYVFTPVVGLLIGIILLNKKFKVNDYVIAIICCIVKIIICVGIWCVSGTSLTLWFGSLLGIVNGLFAVALRSIITKLVNPSEVAKSQALIAVCDVLHPLIFNPIYSHIYSLTKDIFFEAVILLTPILIFIPFILLLGMYLLHKHYLKYPKPEEHSQDVQHSEREQYLVTQLVNAIRHLNFGLLASVNK